MEKCLVSIWAEDGTHRKMFSIYKKALSYISSQLGRKVEVDMEIEAFAEWIDNYGRRITISIPPKGIYTVRDYEKMIEAFNNRECGTATPEQLKLLQNLDL
jgi:hypothetical protein